MGDVWLLQYLDDEAGYRVLRCDARTGETVATMDVVEPRPMAHDSAQLAVGAGAVWVAAGHVFLYRVDPVRLKVTAAVSVGHHLDGLVVTDDAVWISNDRGGGRLLRIDPGDNRLDLAIPFRAHALAAGAGAVWATWTHTITRVDEIVGPSNRDQARHPFAVELTSGTSARAEQNNLQPRRGLGPRGRLCGGGADHGRGQAGHGHARYRACPEHQVAPALPWTEFLEVHPLPR